MTEALMRCADGGRTMLARLARAVHAALDV